MNEPVKFLVEYVLRKSENEDLKTRINLYRSIAEIAPSEKLAFELRKMADELDSVARKSRQLQFDLFSS